MPLADKAIGRSSASGFIVAEEVQRSAIPCAPVGPAARGTAAGDADRRVKLNKAERELLAFLELHPGIAQPEGSRRHGQERQRGGAVAGAQRTWSRSSPSRWRSTAGPIRAPHALNPAQQAAFEQIHDGHRGAAIPDVSAARRHRIGQDRSVSQRHRGGAGAGRGALLLVPEIALTPADGRPVLLPLRRPRGDPALARFTDAERAEQWRRIRSGAAAVVVGTRSGVFAPVRNLGLIVVDEEHDRATSRRRRRAINGRDVAIVRAQAAGRVRGAGLGYAQPGEPLQRRARQVHAARTARPHRGAAHAAGAS